MATSSLPNQKLSLIEKARADLWLSAPKFVGDRRGYGVGAEIPEELYGKHTARIHSDPLFRRAVEDDLEAIFSKERVADPRRLSIAWKQEGVTFDTDGNACGIGYFSGRRSGTISEHNVDTYGQGVVLFVGLTSYMRRLYTAFAALENSNENPIPPAENALRSEGRTIQAGEKRSMYVVSEPRPPSNNYGIADDSSGYDVLGSYVPHIRSTPSGYSVHGRLLDTDETVPGRRFMTKGFMGFYEDTLKQMIGGIPSQSGGPNKLEVKTGEQGLSFVVDDNAKLYPVRDGKKLTYESEGVTNLGQALVLLTAFAMYTQYALRAPGDIMPHEKDVIPGISFTLQL